MDSIVNRIITYFSKMFIYVYRYTSSRRFFRSLLKYVPSSVLIIGDRFAMKSLDQSLLVQPKQGSIALITQSGALKIIVLNMMAREGLGLSRLISYDDRKDKSWDEAELLEELAEDPETKVIMFCAESINQGRKFMNAAKKTGRMKPIIVLKSGKSKVGARAVLSHVGSLAGSDEIRSAAFKQSHVLRAQTIEEMLDFAKALSFQRLARGSKVAIITNGGGAGIIAADACISRRLEVPELPLSIQKYLKENLPLFSGVTNPLDLKVAATAEIYVEALDSLLRYDGIDMLILMVYPTPALDLEKFVDKVLKLWGNNQKPMVVSATGSHKFIEHLRKLEECGIPLYIVPERAAAGATALVYYGRYQTVSG